MKRSKKDGVTFDEMNFEYFLLLYTEYPNLKRSNFWAYLEYFRETNATVLSILPKSKVCKMTKLECKENHVKRTRKQPNVSNLQLTILMNPKLHYKLGLKF